MPLIEPNGRPFVTCVRCRVSVVLPADEHAGNLPAFAALVRRDSVAAMRMAEQTFGMGPRESKALVLHVSDEQGRCRRCDAPVPEGVSVCSCRSVALNW
jgi:hypothetical protein